ncbi:MAG: hypothetical protein JW944_10800, partial [Deltaproteobacteria bacterium]|nr:hypothetical protein [Deltaproteobacteria bacterium]
NLSPKGLCLLVKEDSAVLAHLKVGDIVDMKYYKADYSRSGKYMRTQIRYITKDEEGRFKGHYKVGISVPEAEDCPA